MSALQIPLVRSTILSAKNRAYKQDDLKSGIIYEAPSNKWDQAKSDLTYLWTLQADLLYSARAQGGPQEMERNEATAKHIAWPSCAWLLLTFFPYPVGHPDHVHCTACRHRMAHRKWKEAKLQPGTAGPGNMLGCSLVSFHFLWAILCPQAVGICS